MSDGQGLHCDSRVRSTARTVHFGIPTPSQAAEGLMQLGMTGPELREVARSRPSLLSLSFEESRDGGNSWPPWVSCFGCSDCWPA
jgi:hypothetical protein